LRASRSDAPLSPSLGISHPPPVPTSKQSPDVLSSHGIAHYVPFFVTKFSVPVAAGPAQGMLLRSPCYSYDPAQGTIA